MPQGISLQISYGLLVSSLYFSFLWSRKFHWLFHSDSLGDFIVNFISIAWCFQWTFHSCISGISLSISYSFPCLFNKKFIPYLSRFHYEFHIYSLLLSIDFHYCTLRIWLSISYLFTLPLSMNIKYRKMNKLIIKNYLWYLEWNSQNIHMYLI